MSNSKIYLLSRFLLFFVFSGNSFHFLKVSVYEVPIKGRNGPSAKSKETMEAYKAKAALFPGQAIALRA